MRTLLSDNVPSCRVFGETGCLQRLPLMLRLPTSHKKDDATTVRLACQLLWEMLACVRHNRPDLARTQDALHKLQVLPLLLSHLTDPSTATDPALRLQALCTLAELVRGHADSAERLLSATTTRRQGESLVEEEALPRILYVGLSSSSAAWQASTAHLFECLLSDGPAVQFSLAASLSAPSSAALSPELSVGTMALNALLSSSVGAVGPAQAAQAWLASGYTSVTPRLHIGFTTAQAWLASGYSSVTHRLHIGYASAQAWLASGVLSSLLHANTEIQRLALALAGDSADGPSASHGLLQRLARLLFASLRSELPPLVQLALVRLLVVWVWGCAEAAAAFCAPTANLPSLLDALSQPSLDPHVRACPPAPLSSP